MTAYLVANPPAIKQFRSPRRQKPTGLTVAHTAENALDAIAPDSGAENVARYETTRLSYGSYHDLVDSDSIIQLVRYGDEAFHDATGSNPWSLSISFACRTSDWVNMSPRYREGILRNGATAFARQQAWLRSVGAPTTPLRRVSKIQSDNKEPGFISHAERDPARRSDPGKDFPWAEFFRYCAASQGGPVSAPVPVPVPALAPPPTYLPLLVDGIEGARTITEEERALKKTGEYLGIIEVNYNETPVRGDYLKAGWQRFLRRKGFYMGLIDSDYGPVSITAEQRWLSSLGFYQQDNGRPAIIEYDLGRRPVRGVLCIKGVQRALNARKVA